MYIPATAAICAVLALGMCWHLMTERAKYWALAESSPGSVSEEDADMKLLIVGNSFIYYNGGADKVCAAALLMLLVVFTLTCKFHMHAVVDQALACMPAAGGGRAHTGAAGHQGVCAEVHARRLLLAAAPKGCRQPAARAV